MYQVIKQTNKEKMTMYKKLSKKELISMLIEANKVIDKFTPIVDMNCKYIPEEPKCVYFSDGTTAMSCMHCGKSKWEH